MKGKIIGVVVVVLIIALLIIAAQYIDVAGYIKQLHSR